LADLLGENFGYTR